MSFGIEVGTPVSKTGMSSILSREDDSNINPDLSAALLGKGTELSHEKSPRHFLNGGGFNEVAASAERQAPELKHGFKPQNPEALEA